MDSILRIVTACLLLHSTGCNRSSAETTTPQGTVGVETGSIDAALAGPHRTPAERARDAFRHPAETLSFFGLEPDMTVVEIWPGRGWYTAVLAPVLRDHGKLITATMDPLDTTFRGRFAKEFAQRMAVSPHLYDQVASTVMFKDQLAIAPPESVDLVVSFRSIHNWVRWEGHSAAKYFQAIAAALKPGGVLGIVQHRAPAGTPGAESGNIGYLTDAFIVRLAQQAGLALIDRSDINANPLDTHDHPNGVWSLPPTLRGGEVDRDKYVAIGESDRMTLTFQKPSSLE